MTYLAKETSVEDSQPVELYLFTNSESEFTYTSGQEDVVHLGKTYVPRPISRTTPEIQAQQTDRNLVVRLPLNDAFVQRYVTTLPASPDNLTIFRLHSTDGGAPEVVTFFVGQVVNAAITGNEAKVNVVSTGKILGNQLTRQTFRNLCNHILYDARCAVDDSQFKMLVTVTAISTDGLTITVSGGTNTILDTGLQLSAQIVATADFFNGGFFRRAGIEHRMILTTVDNGGDSADFTVLLPFETLGAGTVMELFAGCDHQLPTCTAKFTNTPRYGGFPFVPGRNPFETGVDN